MSRETGATESGRLSERRDEAIAAAGHIDDITGRLAGIAERLAQRCDMEAQAALVDIDVGPDALDQLSLVDDFTGAPGQEDEDIEARGRRHEAASPPSPRAGTLETGEMAQMKWPSLRYALARAIAPTTGVKRYYFFGLAERGVQ
ncbi:hypothetical protein BRDID11002_84130 [Bradyrhizobium diazoefficiens]